MIHYTQENSIRILSRHSTNSEAMHTLEAYQSRDSAGVRYVIKYLDLEGNPATGIDGDWCVTVTTSEET